MNKGMSMPIDNKDAENKKSTQKVGRFFLTIIIGLSTISIIIYISGASDVIRNFKSMNLLWATYLFLASVGILFVDSFRTYYLIRVLGYKLKYSHALENSVLGFYVSAITPFSAGGQPFQIWHLTKLGLKVEEASIVVGVKF
ncbi:MAG: flippase-like domain-containing protein, partial [Thermotogaceae bacterium]|nr:flippase-like domain-containing protein [Thermotogaceae bacterium]